MGWQAEELNTFFTWLTNILTLFPLLEGLRRESFLIFIFIDMGFIIILAICLFLISTSYITKNKRRRIQFGTILQPICNILNSILYFPSAGLFINLQYIYIYIYIGLLLSVNKCGDDGYNKIISDLECWTWIHCMFAISCYIIYFLLFFITLGIKVFFYEDRIVENDISAKYIINII